MRLRHLHFTQSLEPLEGGGLGSSTVALHRQMVTAGVESTLCSTHGATPQFPGDHTLEFRRIKPDSLYFAPDLYRKSSELTAAADVLHGHGLYVGTNYIFGREARRQGKILVYHVHGFFEPWILERSRWKKRLVHWLFEDANFRHVRLWRALTAKEADQIRNCGIKAPIVIAPNGLDVKEFPPLDNPDAPIETPQISRLRKTGPRLLFLGRMHPKKGLDLLLSAWERLRAERESWELVIAGPNELGYEQELRDQARSLRVEGQVQFTGPVTGRSKNALLHSADLVVLPSYSEGFPMSLLEAMACRVPVVATQTCNFPEIAASHAGWECEPSRESLASTLQVALNASPQERKQRGDLGRKLVETHYSWTTIINTLVTACSACC